MSSRDVQKPRSPGEAVNPRLLIATVVVVVAVFLGDLFVPLGIAGGVLYVGAVLLALSLPSPYVYGCAVACTVLTVTGYFASLEGGGLPIDLANRGVALFAIWVAAVLGLHRRKLSEEVHRHGQIIDQVQDGVITIDMNGAIDYWNKGAESVFGYSANEIVGKSVGRLYASGDPEVIQEQVVARLLAEGSAELETEGVKRNGDVIVIRQWLLLRRRESYEPAGVILQVSDITRRREVERAAIRMEAFYQNVLDELPLQVAIFDTEGRFLYLNPASLSNPETRAWIIGKTERDYFERVGRNLPAVNVRDVHRHRAMAERTTVTYEEEFETRSGEMRSYLHGFSPVVGADGEIVKVIGYRYDITDHKRTAWALQESLARLEAFRQLDQAILTASSTKDVAKVAVDHLAHLVPAATVCIALLDTSEDTASVLTVQCEGRMSRESSASIHEFLGVKEESEVLACIAGACIDGHLTMVPTTDASGSDVASVIAVPLVVQDSTIGILKLEAKSGAHFGEEDIDIAKEVAGVLAIAINDARLFEEIDASRKRLQALSHRLVEVQEEERRLIARELHDEIGQALTGLKFSLETVQAHADSQNAEQIEESRRITLQLLARVRDLSLDLRPAMLDDLGLLPALLWLADRYSNQTGVEVRLRHSGLDERLDPDIETAAYRIVQEALTNVARHAGRAQVDIILIASAATLVVQVKDDGAGFSLKEVLDRKDSSGLSGMYERASLLGGTVTIKTEQGRGTTISAEFPLTAIESMETAS